MYQGYAHVVVITHNKDINFRPSREVQPTPMDQRLRCIYVANWVERWQAAAAHVVLAAIEAGRLTLHTPAGGAALYMVEWRGNTILVTEASSNEAPYRFSDMRAALTFLDALLINYVADVTEPRVAAPQRQYS